MGFSRYCLVPWISWILRSGSAVQKPPRSSDWCPPMSRSQRNLVPDPGIWKSENPGIWKSRNPELWKSKIQQNPKNRIMESKSVSPKLSVMSGLVGKKTSWPLLGPFQLFFSGPKNAIFCLCSLVSQGALFTRFGVICWCHACLGTCPLHMWPLILRVLCT